MKTIKNINFKYFSLLGFMFLLMGCDLDVQEGFDFKPESNATDPFDDITAWQWLQTRTALNDEGNLSGEQFNYMIAAIERAGMVDEYNNANITDRTYLMLNNNAFTGNGDIIDLVTGDSSVAAGETPANVMARADVNVLRLILQYHIVTSYVDQVPTLFEYGVNYQFQTLIPGEDGIIIMRRDERYRIDINRSPAPLPSSATSQFERVRGHNYVFLNGIGHIIADPVRNKPYPAPIVP